VVSTLLAESGTLKANRDRDDRALYDTLKALHARLLGNCEVPNPLGGSNLTSRGEVLNQVTRLRDRLGKNLPKLASPRIELPGPRPFRFAPRSPASPLRRNHGHSVLIARHRDLSPTS